MDERSKELLFDDLFGHTPRAVENIPPSNQSTPNNPEDVGYIPVRVWVQYSLEEHQ